MSEAKVAAKTIEVAMKEKERAKDTKVKKVLIKAKAEVQSAVKDTAKTCKPAMKANVSAKKATAKTCKTAMKAEAKAKTAITMIN